MTDVFDRINYSDIFDRVNFSDIFERIDLPVEDKVIFSKELKELLKEEIVKKIGELPIGSIIASAVKREMQKKLEKEVVLRSVIERRTKEVKSVVEEKIDSKEKELNKKIEELEDKLKKSEKKIYDKMNQPEYVFGGFSPTTNFSNVFYFGDQTTEGSWRIVVSGSDLNAERLEGGSWVFKGGFNP